MSEQKTESKKEMLYRKNHEIRAGNRLIQSGMPVEKVNKYLKDTPLEQIVKDNVKHESQFENK